MKINQIHKSSPINALELKKLNDKLNKENVSLDDISHTLFVSNNMPDEESELPPLNCDYYIVSNHPLSSLKKLNATPETDGIHVITLLGDSDLLYSRQTSTLLQKFLQQQGYLNDEKSSLFHMLIQESLINAIEYGNLELTGEKDNLISQEQWFEEYRSMVDSRLREENFAQKQVLIQCYLIEDELITSVTDEGSGFDYENKLKEVEQEELKDDARPHGMGIGLLKQMAHSIRYDNEGKTFRFGLKMNFLREKVLSGAQKITIKGLRSTGRVLIVDDQPSNRQFAKFYLVSAGYTHIEEAESGEEALEKTKTFKPDIILLDIVMPGITGFAVCRLLKQNPKTADIPVLFLSGLTDAKSRVKGYRLGAVDYVNKPIDRNELIARTDIHIQNAAMFNSLQTFSQRIEKDLEKAKISQESLLPKDEEIQTISKKHNLEINHIFDACDELAGDYWSIFDVADDHVAIVMADFTGHGVAAALNTVFLHSMLYELSVYMINPQQLTSMINTRLHALLSIGNFATFVFGTLNTQTGEFDYVSCGCPPIAVLPADTNEDPNLLDGSGIPLGLAPSDSITFEERSCQLQPGDRLFFYSDALTETPHGEQGMWMDEGLIKALKKLREKEPQVKAQNVLNHFNKTAELPLKDDLTLISVTYRADK